MESEIPLIKREIKDLCEFKTDMTQKFENRKPAEVTYEFINKTNLEMQKQTDNLENLTRTLDMHVSDQKIQDALIKKNLDEFQVTLLERIDLFIEGSDKKYAPIMVYKILVWAGGIAGAALIIGLLTLIYKTIIAIEK
jgi:hypothetical protein